MIGKTVRYSHSVDNVKVESTLRGIIYDKILIDGNDHYLILNQNGELEPVECWNVQKVLSNSRKV